MSAIEHEAAVRATTAGSKWYRHIKGAWHEEDVVRVTKTTVVLRDDTRISKATSKDKEGRTWFPPTPEMVELYEAQEMGAAAQTLYLAALDKLQAAARCATPTQLRHLVTQMENVIDLSGIK